MKTSYILVSCTDAAIFSVQAENLYNNGYTHLSELKVTPEGNTTRFTQAFFKTLEGP